MDYGDGFNSQVAPGEMPIGPLESKSEENVTEGSSPLPSPEQIEAQSLDKGVFLLVLKNGGTHAATDYWVADGYFEYISPDGTRSHVPLDAVDFERTVTANAPRGLPFVLRSAPAGNR